VNHALLVGRVFQSGAQTAPQQAHHLMSESFALIQPKLARELGGAHSSSNPQPKRRRRLLFNTWSETATKKSAAASHDRQHK